VIAELGRVNIVETVVCGVKAWHAECVTPGCDWRSRRFDTNKSAARSADRHLAKH
jgi:hypothetical protein